MKSSPTTALSPPRFLDWPPSKPNPPPAQPLRPPAPRYCSPPNPGTAAASRLSHCSLCCCFRPTPAAGWRHRPRRPPRNSPPPSSGSKAEPPWLNHYSWPLSKRRSLANRPVRQDRSSAQIRRGRKVHSVTPARRGGGIADIFDHRVTSMAWPCSALAAVETDSTMRSASWKAHRQDRDPHVVIFRHPQTRCVRCPSSPRKTAVHAGPAAE